MAGTLLGMGGDSIDDVAIDFIKFKVKGLSWSMMLALLGGTQAFSGQLAVKPQMTVKITNTQKY